VLPVLVMPIQDGQTVVKAPLRMMHEELNSGLMCIV